MNRGLRVMLVLLRLAIGWHLLVEGLSKMESVAQGDTARHRAWTSRPYLLEAQGPLGSWFRDLAGDPDRQVNEFLRFPLSEQPKPTARMVMPLKVRDAWEQYVDQLFAYYRIDKRRKTPFGELLSQTLEKHKRMFCQDKILFTEPFPMGMVSVPQTLPERISDYDALYDQYQTILNKELPAFGKDVRKQKLAEIKSELARRRTEVLQEVFARSDALRKEIQLLFNLLESQQGNLPLAAWLATPQPNLAPLTIWLSVSVCQTPSFDFFKPFVNTDPMQEYRNLPRPGPMMPYIDLTMRWGLTLAGAGLLLGLCTRIWCLLGASLLLLIFLAMPPLPGVPDNPKSMGNALYINQTLIEAMALAMLMFTPSGRWLGLDAVWGLFRRRQVNDIPTQIADESGAGQPAPHEPQRTKRRK